MKGQRPFYVIIAILVAVVAAVPVHGISLFTAVFPDSTGGLPLPTVFAAYPVVIDLVGLEQGPSSLDVEIPGVGIVETTLDSFDPRVGYDGLGVPLPGNTTEDLEYIWRGRSLDGWDVILSVVSGKVSGMITGPDGTYSLRKYNGMIQLVDLDLDAFPTDVAPDPPAVTTAPVKQGPFRVTPMSLPPPRKASALPETVEFDVLFLYTEQARLDAEEVATDPNEINIIRSIVYGAVEDFNLALENSDVNARARVALVGLLEGFVPTGDPTFDLETLYQDSGIQAIRDAAQADVVSVVLRNATNNGLVNVCGQAVVQRPGCADPGAEPIPGCNPGEEFEPFAYHFTAVNCTRQWRAYAHEQGHNLSGEHDRGNYSVEDDQAAYTFDFGYWTYDFGTLMSLKPSAAKIDFYFANPRVLHEDFGVPVGVVGENDVSRAIELLIATMSGFRGPPNSILFIDNFETGDTEPWSSTMVSILEKQREPTPQEPADWLWPFPQALLPEVPRRRPWGIAAYLPA